LLSEDSKNGKTLLIRIVLLFKTKITIMKVFSTLLLFFSVCILYSQSNNKSSICEIKETSNFPILIGNESRNLVLKTERLDSDLFVLSLDGQPDEEKPIFAKYNDDGDIIWNLTWEDSTYVNNFLIDNNRIFLTGFTRPFANGNSGLLIELNDLGNSVVVESSQKLNISSQREATRGIIKLNSSITPYALLLHRGWISIDDTQIALLDINGELVNIKNYNLSDDQVWTGPVNDLDNTITIFGEEANEVNEGFLINAALDLNSQEAYSFFGIGYIRAVGVDVNRRQRLLVSNKALTLVDEKYNDLHALSMPGIIGNRMIDGPFLLGGSTYYYVLSQVEISGERKMVISKIEIDQSNFISVDWSKMIDADGSAANGYFSTSLLGGDNVQFSIGQTLESPSNGFGNWDISLSEFDESSCNLIDVSLETNNIEIDVVRQELEVSDQAVPEMSILDTEPSISYSCNEIKSCDPCDNDTIPPTLNCVSPAGIYDLNNQGELVLTTNDLNATTFDDCEGRISIELSKSFFTCNDIGFATITITATDESGNSNSCDVNITITDPNSYCECQEDNSPPVLSCSQETVIYELNEEGTSAINLDLHRVKAFDNCRIDRVVPKFEFLDCSMLTTVPSTVQVTAIDFTGNVTNCEISFILIDPNGFCIPESCDISCFDGTIDLSTGINNTGQFLPIGEYVGNWMLIDGPDDNVFYPRPGFVLNPNNAWNQLPGSQYISPFPNAFNNDSSPIPYLFERCFCVCEETAEVELNISAHVDNFINIGLYEDNGNLIQDLIGFQGPASTTAFRDPAFFSNTKHVLSQGTYCLRAGLRNDGSVAMGMQINAAITNAGFVSSECCNPYSSILGTVFQDVSCDSLNNLNTDIGIQGIEVSLINNGEVVESVLSDQFGYYVFNDISPGNYTISAESVPNNFPTVGVVGYDIIMTADTIIGNLDFGFCEEKDECCASSELLTERALFELNSDALFYEMNGTLEVENPELFECQYVSTIYWGDGQSEVLGPNDAIPSHDYNGNGVYLLSFEVSAVLNSGEECQLDEVNHIIIIEDCTVSTDFPNAKIPSIKLYPIPFSEIVNIDFSQNTSGYLLEVFNIAGQLIDSAEIDSYLDTYTYDSQNLTSGTYLFRIVSLDGITILRSKVVKI